MSDEQDGSQRRGTHEPSAAKHAGPDRSSPYAVSRLSGPVSLVDAAREIERADQWIASTSSAALEQIAAQMRALREQAERVLDEARQNAELHRAEARFSRHPGKIYHLYERSAGQRYWSMLSPHDWGERVPPGYLGSYRLEGDQSWTPVERIAERDRQRAPVQDWFARAFLPDAGTRPESALVRSRAEEPRAWTPAASGEPTSPTSTAGRNDRPGADKDPACESSSLPRSDPTDPA